MSEPRDIFSELGSSEADELALAELPRLLEPRPTSAAARARLLAAVRTSEQRWAPFFDKLGRLFDLSLAELARLSVRAADPPNWEILPLDGVRLLHLDAGPRLAGADAGLVWIEAGLDFPEHRHLGEERTLVLDGMARDSSGELLRPGDERVMSGGSTHSFQVLSAGPFIYALVLFDAVEIGGQRFPPAAPR
jgi:hypothetical protein